MLAAGPPNAPHIYADARELVAGFGGQTCPIILPDRAAYRKQLRELPARAEQVKSIAQLSLSR